jgi:hypothetical protein
MSTHSLQAWVRAAVVGITFTAIGPVYAASASPDVEFSASAEVEITDRVGAEATAEIPDRVGQEVLASGDRVDVVVYVHTYPQPIEVYPRVWWAGRWYYNVEGNLVFYDPFYGGWSFYWGPPRPLITVWNHHHPDVVFSWGVGFYGRGYYYGGVAETGWHAHARPPRHYHRGRVYRQPKADRGERRRPAKGERAGPPKRQKQAKGDRDRDDDRKGAKRTTPRDDAQRTDDRERAGKRGKRADDRAKNRAQREDDGEVNAKTRGKRAGEAARNDTTPRKQGPAKAKRNDPTSPPFTRNKAQPSRTKRSPATAHERGNRPPTSRPQPRGPQQKAPAQRAPAQRGPVHKAPPQRGPSQRAAPRPSRGGGGGKRGR